MTYIEHRFHLNHDNKQDHIKLDQNHHKAYTIQVQAFCMNK